jgi:hypothetical protein
MSKSHDAYCKNALDRSSPLTACPALVPRSEDRRLKLAEPIVETNNPVMKLVGQTCPAGIDTALHGMSRSRRLRAEWRYFL